MTARRKSAPKLTCLDDVPELVRRAAHQQFFLKWGQLLAILPLVVVVIVVTRFFGRSSSLWLTIPIGASLVWALTLIAYSAYLWLTLRCPACQHIFGTGQACRSCHLPRHRS